LCILAEVLGTGCGCLISAIWNSHSDKTTSLLLSFAGGIMLGVVFFELIPDAINHANLLSTLIGLTLGIILVLVLNQLIDRVSNNTNKNSSFHQTFKDFFHEQSLVSDNKDMLNSGILMFLVIGLHNFPEGLAMGATGVHDLSLGIILIVIFGLHSIPEGMSISAPLISAGLSKRKAIFLTLITGIPTALGAILGTVIGKFSNTSLAISLSMAGGAMLYAVLGEILPQSMNMRKDRFPIISLILGLIAGFFLTLL
jgi:ZIP family zinc transporter